MSVTVHPATALRFGEVVQMTEFEKAKRRLKRGFTRLLKEAEQTIRDIEWWNRHRTEHPPMDAEWFRVQADGLRKCLRAIERGERIDESWLLKS